MFSTLPETFVQLLVACTSVHVWHLGVQLHSASQIAVRIMGLGPRSLIVEIGHPGLKGSDAGHHSLSCSTLLGGQGNGTLREWSGPLRRRRRRRNLGVAL